MSEKTPEQLERLRSKKDINQMMNYIMNTKYFTKGDAVELEDIDSLEKMSEVNTSVLVRTLARAAHDAANGDPKAREFCMDHSGYIVHKEQNINIKLPTIIDDMSDDLKEIEGADIKAIEADPRPVEAVTIYMDAKDDA